GAGMANSAAGVPDIGLLTLTEVARLAGYIANAVNIPAIVDADTGFGGAEMSREQFENWNRRDWPVVTSRTRNFRSVADISLENRLSMLTRWSEKLKRRWRLEAIPIS